MRRRRRGVLEAADLLVRVEGWRQLHGGQSCVDASVCAQCAGTHLHRRKAVTEGARVGVAATQTR